MNKRYLYPGEKRYDDPNKWQPLVHNSEQWDEQKDCHVVDWRRARQVLQHEDWLIIERVKLLLASQTLLSASFYFVHKLTEKTNEVISLLLHLCVLIGIAGFGVFLAMYISRGMKAARAHQDKIIWWWYSRFDYVPKQGDPLPAMMAMQPPIAGKDPTIISERRLVNYDVIARVFAIMWVIALTYSIVLSVYRIDDARGHWNTSNKIGENAKQHGIK